MGAVYLALDSKSKNKQVAVKEMSTRTVNGKLQGAIAAFEKEAALLSSLRHPQLPRIIDFFSLDEEHRYLVMDYIEGLTLKEIAENNGKLDEVDVLNWGRQLCEILDYLHKQNPPIIFRDLKPANIMLTPEGRIKLIDFGIARHFRPGGTADTSAHGTRGFAPPEQYGTDQSDPRSDIYALGATLHYLLTAQDPAQNHFTFEAPSQMVKVSPWLEEAVMKALEVRPGNRPGSMQEMLHLLSSETSVAAARDIRDIDHPVSQVINTNIGAADREARRAGNIRKIFVAGCLLTALISAGTYTYIHSWKDVQNYGIEKKGSQRVQIKAGRNTDSATNAVANNNRKTLKKTEEDVNSDGLKQELEFNDPALEQAVREAINKPEGAVYQGDIKDLQELDLSRKGIKNITVLKSFTNLKRLDLSENENCDLGVLKGLTSLLILDLTNNEISDLSFLEGMTNLQILRLEYNKISDISNLKGLNNLTTLDLNFNRISDISPVRGMSNLQSLALYASNIKDINALEGLIKLRALNLSNNKISDITPLQGLTNLKELYLEGNVISDYSPVKLYYTNLQKRDFEL